MKRTRDSLTGGTHDVSPQIYSLNISQLNIDLTRQLEFPVPVMRYPTRKGRAMVMEVLRIIWIVEDFTTIGATTSIVGLLSTSRANLSDGTSSTNSEQFRGLASPTTFGWLSIDGIFGDATGFHLKSRVTEQGLTDSAGHGILVATDFIYFTLASLGTGSTNTVAAKVIYRWKEVSLEEYIGIVQAQQQVAD